MEELQQLNALLMFNIALLLAVFGLARAFLGIDTLLNLMREQREREQLLVQAETDWSESFTGSIDEFLQRDAA